MRLLALLIALLIMVAGLPKTRTGAPEEVARQVVDAIRQRQFWILTHPEMDARLSDRADRMLARCNPEVPELAPKNSPQ